MAQQRSAIGGGGYKQETVYKQEPGVPVAANDHHQSHHPHQGPPQHLPHQRPGSVGHPQHHPQQPTSQHSNAYHSSHLSQYAPNGSSQVAQHSQEVPYYSHPSPYTAPSAAGPYTSAAAETPDVMAAGGMPRPHYPAIYHTPQSNSPASIASPSGHDQYGRQLYNQAPSHMQQQSMNYPPPPQSYPPMPQGNPSPYAQQAAQQHHAMGPQSSLLMSHQTGQHQMQHPSQQQMTSSPRGTKQENIPPQLQQRSAPVSQGQAPPQHHNQQIMNTTAPNGTANNIGGAGVSPSTNPGPIPATTPLVVRQDNNGVQWIAFEYSRDRVKMEYTIRCDVESVDVEQLSAEFKNENCVYPRACCDKAAYRGNRFTYETDCNTVGWGLAELNPCLRGKRGLIQRAVDSWRNSNSDPKYRSRRVRRMAKINHRKINNIQSINAMGGQGANMMAGLPLGGPDMTRAVQPGVGVAQQRPLGAPTGLPGQMHHHHAHPDGAAGGGPDDGSGSDPSTLSPQQQQAHSQPSIQASQARSNSQSSLHTNGQYNGYASQSHPTSASASSSSNRQAQQWPQNYPVPQDRYADQSSRVPLNTITNGEGGGENRQAQNVLDPALFPPVKHPQYIHVQDEDRTKAKKKIEVRLGGKCFSHVDKTLGIHGQWVLTEKDTTLEQAPDSERRKNSVWPKTWKSICSSEKKVEGAPRQVWREDIGDSAGDPEDGREAARRRANYREGKKVTVLAGVDGTDEMEVEIPRVMNCDRELEEQVNELGVRMGWVGQKIFTHQDRDTSYVRKVFLQRTLDMYRNKIAKAIKIEGAGRGFGVEEYPIFDMRRARREFQEKWGPRNDVE